MWHRESLVNYANHIQSEALFEQWAYEYCQWLSFRCGMTIRVAFEALLASERFIPSPYRGASPRSEYLFGALIGEVLLECFDAYWDRLRNGSWVVQIEYPRSSAVLTVDPQKIVAIRLWRGISVPVQVHRIALDLQEQIARLENGYAPRSVRSSQ